MSKWELGAIQLFDLRLIDEGRTLHCPVCRCNCTHIRSVGTLLGRDPLEASVYEGTATTGSTGERRSALEIIFDGECGHEFRFVIQQHKGENYATVVFEDPDNQGMRPMPFIVPKDE